MTIIPAIDIMNGKCVRLTKGDYESQTIYNENPLEVAKQFEDAGLKRLHLVDLDGAKAGEVKNWKMLELIAGKTKLVIDFSGGISTQENLEIAFNSGAFYVTIGSMAVKNEQTFSDWIIKYGAEKFIIAADVKSNRRTGHIQSRGNENIVVKGWTKTTDLSVYDLIGRYKTKGVEQFLCTDVNKDGMLQGPAIELYKKILARHSSIYLIASGGVSSCDDIYQLKGIGCKAVIIGKAIYEGRISLEELQKINNQ
ncbi:MAG TPA: 1-(5-phosphoribosyl)-5-[(5-phosphoribosylamino)methylideneamino]imidazole-4-carboxamide isomerase [Chitinophagaceae bacterium]|nr:1-(5-phosphoribosyl)-5-[(5-phosphoribosylamino)methylideneamino]imidazole-4-carboxamide isomerase [Chitinophagaceae bacterium]